MAQLISFMHISLDGFVAGPNSEMNWIAVNEEIFDHIGKRIGQTDTALYGRNTYQIMEGYWPTAADKPAASQHDINHSAWYKQAHKVVLSTTMQGASLPNTTIISSNLAPSIAELKEKNEKEILVFGSPAATHSLLRLNLVDGFWLFVNPVILGQGIPLFKDIQQRIDVTLISSRPFACGVTELNYMVNKR